ncbi:MAG: AAA family ATPase [Planctomycetaceae bacterium]|jgi:predicted ATPase
MPITELSLRNYRSLRDVRLSLGRLTVVTGPNGSGKSNLYRALWLLSQIAEGGFARALCQEGGLASALWAGPRRSKDPWRMSVGFRTDDLSFQLDCGFPIPGNTLFGYDPQIKEEAVWLGKVRRPSTTLVDRRGGTAKLRESGGETVEYPAALTENESVLSQLREPQRFPELYSLRDEMRQWRFYHGFRTDAEAPLRTPQISVRTPVLSHDGSDLAAALQTILEVGDARTLHEAIGRGLPGRVLEILANDPDPTHRSPRTTELCVALRTEGCLRPLVARELSDGTLKYLCLVAALLSPRPPALIALNEPEASLHPDLLAPLAELIVDAARYSQVWVTTHSTPLAEAIERKSRVSPVVLRLVEGETMVREADESDEDSSEIGSDSHPDGFSATGSAPPPS